MYKYTQIDTRSIGDRIREKRKACGLSQQDFLDSIPDELRFGRNTLSDLENGKEKAFHSVSVMQWAAMCEIFDCSIGSLLGEYEARTYDHQFLLEGVGLSEKAVDKLFVWKSTYVDADTQRQVSFDHFLRLLSQIIEHPAFGVAMGSMEGYLIYEQAARDNPKDSEADRNRKINAYDMNYSIRRILDDIVQNRR